MTTESLETKQQANQRWRNNIVGFAMVDPKLLRRNPKNIRDHKQFQRELMVETLDHQGWTDTITVNVPYDWNAEELREAGLLFQHHPNFDQATLIEAATKGVMTDGHMRMEESVTAGEPLVPVTFVSLTEEQEALELIGHDQITGLADLKVKETEQIMGEISQKGGRIDDFLAEIENTFLANALSDALDLPNPFDDTDDEDLEGPEVPDLPDSSAPEKKNSSLADRFLVPPFSILDTKQGYWQDRKKLWLEMGIQSELGRGGDDKARTFGQDLMRGEHKLGTSSSEDDQNQTGTSIFDPVLTELAYRWFCPTKGKILDPFAGGSVRGIVAAVIGYPYVGVDLRPEQVQANQAQARNIVKRAPYPTWQDGDSRDLSNIVPGLYDLVFSCPPYGDLERYSDDPKDLSTMDYPEFIKAYRDIVREACAMLRDNRFAVFVVGDIRDKKGYYRNFVSDTVKAFLDAGMKLYNEAILLTPMGSLPVRVGKQFEATRKLGKAHQNVLVFVKGDPRKATEDCGPVDMAALGAGADDED
jgi:hypothetical protein